MKICFVCCEYARERAGGQGVAVRMTANGLAELGHEVRVIGHGASSGDADYTEVPVPSGPLGWLRGRRLLWQQVRAWAYQGEVDVVEVPLSRGFCAGLGPLPVPVVVRVHGSRTCKELATGGEVPRLHRRLETASLARADAVTAVSEFMAEQLKRVFRRNAHVIHNAVAIPPQVKPWAQRERELIYVGTNSRAKGLGVLLAVWPQLEWLNCSLKLYGRIQLDALPARVELCGQVPHAELLGALQNAQGGVFPSRFEAFGLAAAEAMASGVATLVSSAGAGGELGDSFEHCLHCTPEASELASMIPRLLDSRVGGRCAARAPAQIEQKFARAVILPQLAEFYQAQIDRWRENGKDLRREG